MSTQNERRANGIDLLRTLGGGSYDPARAATAMVRRHGALGTFAVDHVLGNLWSRPQLSRRDRSLIVVTFLAVLELVRARKITYAQTALFDDISFAPAPKGAVSGLAHSA